VIPHCVIFYYKYLPNKEINWILSEERLFNQNVYN
jgi:hypothetical protein